MNKIWGWATSKTVWGTIVLASSFVPQLAPVAPYLHTVGTALAGVGVADKLDKIKAAASTPAAPTA